MGVAHSGDDALASKFGELFALLRECVELFSVPRSMCAHEITRLQERATVLSQKWPRTLTPKFHVMLHHMAPFARQWASIGLGSEQCIESSHRVFNEFERTFAGVTSMCVKLKSMVKRFRLRASAKVPTYTPPTRARASDIAND